MMRCFVALRLQTEPRTVLREVVQALQSMPKRAAERIRPVSLGKLHATMKFLGDTDANQVPPLVAALERSAEAFRAATAGFDAELWGLGAFPSIARPRTVFAAVGAGAAQLVDLASRIDAACEPLGFAPEGRKHTPHVTLARVQRAARAGPLSDLLASHREGSLGRIDLSTLVLYESKLTPQSAIHTPLVEVELMRSH